MTALRMIERSSYLFYPLTQQLSELKDVAKQVLPERMYTGLECAGNYCLERFKIYWMRPKSRLYKIAYSQEQNIHQIWQNAFDRQVVYENMVKVSQDWRYLIIHGQIKQIVQKLNLNEQQVLFDEFTKYTIEQEIPEAVDYLCSLFSLDVIQKIVTAKYAGKEIKDLRTIIQDNAGIYGVINQFEAKEVSNFSYRARNFFFNLIPNTIELFLKAFNLMDTGRLEGIWEISYMITILMRVILIPWAIITVIEPLVDNIVEAYAITAGVCAGLIAAVWTYIKWLRPAPSFIHSLAKDMLEDTEHNPSFTGREVLLENILEQLENLLAHGKRHVLLIGHSGVGKTEIIERIADLIRNHKMDKYPHLKKCQRFFGMSLAAIEGNSNYEGFAAILQNIARRIRGFVDRILICFSEIYVAKMNDSMLRDFMLDFLDKRKLSVLAVTSIEEYRKHLLKDYEFLRRFEMITIDPTSKEETQQILESHANAYVPNLLVDDDAIEAIYDKSVKRFPENQPSEAIHMFDQICTKLRERLRQITSAAERRMLKTTRTTLAQKFYKYDSGIQETANVTQHRREFEQNKADLERVTTQEQNEMGEIRHLESIIMLQNHLRKELLTLSARLLKVRDYFTRKTSQVALKKILTATAFTLPEIDRLIPIKENAIRHFDRLQSTKLRVDKHIVNEYFSQNVVNWSFNNPVYECPTGKWLQIMTTAPVTIRWTKDEWKSCSDSNCTLTPEGTYVTELPTALLDKGVNVQFTFFWPQVNKWEEELQRLNPVKMIRMI